MNELVESIVNFIIGVIAPLVIGGYIINKIFGTISRWLTEEKDNALEQLKASGAYCFAQRLLNTSPGATLIGTVSGTKVHVTIVLCTKVIEDATDSTFTWSEPVSVDVSETVNDDKEVEEVVEMLGDGKGEIEVRPRYTEGLIKFPVGTPKKVIWRVRDHLIHALITVREEWARNPPEKPNGEGQEPNPASTLASPAHE